MTSICITSRYRKREQGDPTMHRYLPASDLERYGPCHDANHLLYDINNLQWKAGSCFPPAAAAGGNHSHPAGTQSRGTDGAESADGASTSSPGAHTPTPQSSAQASPACGAASRIRPCPRTRVLDPAPPALRVLCCAAMAPTHAHPHAHRRLWLQGTSTWFLLSLCEACSVRSLHRLGELVEEVLHQRWRDQPSAPLDPELRKLLPH
jgi:hypothetical protein